MRSFFIKKRIAAIACICMLLLFAGLNLKTTLPQIRQQAAAALASSGDAGGGFSALVAEVEATISDQVYQKYAFIEAYGYLQKLLGKDEVNNFEVVKAKDGSLNYTYFTSGPNDVATLVARMERLKAAAEETGSKVQYVMTPDKYIDGETEYRTGIPYNYANETADNFLSALALAGVDTLDFRQLMQEAGVYKTDSFFKTDHHWKIETAFWAYTQFVDALDRQYDFDFPDSAYYTDLENYNQITYPDSYIGSMGRKEGILYSGVEDFTFIYPKFDTDFSFYAQGSDNDISVRGRFEEALCFMSMLTGEDPYDATTDKYFTYMFGNPGFVEITNYDQPDGARVLFIKDSLMVPLVSFFSLGCSKVYLIDPRYYYGNIEDVIRDYAFDYVFVSFSPQNLTEEFFPFYEDAA